MGWCAGDEVKCDLFFFFFTTRTSSSEEEEDWMRELILSKFTTSPFTVRIVSPVEMEGKGKEGGKGSKKEREKLGRERGRGRKR